MFSFRIWADEIGRTSLEKVWLALELEAKIANDWH
jgi:hypothetical protein